MDEKGTCRSRSWVGSLRPIVQCLHRTTFDVKRRVIAYCAQEAQVYTMSGRPGEFPLPTQQLALVRQRNRCASCGTKISALGEAGKATHRFGEGSQAHHINHIKFGGTEALDNCVVLCRSCHYSVHE